MYVCVSGGSAPEPFKRLPVLGVPQLVKGTVTNLADSLPGDAKEPADLLKRHLPAVVKAVVQDKDLPLALGKVLVEDSASFGDRFSGAPNDSY